jgi:hypothetical protein
LADPSLDEVCQVLQLGEYLPIFEREQLTFSDLLLCSEEDLASLSLPMGPRKRLMTYLRDVELRRAKLKQVSIFYYKIFLFKLVSVSTHYLSCPLFLFTKVSLIIPIFIP